MINNFPLTNIYEKPSKNSKLSSQMIYGEKFKIISKKNYWLKIKTNFDHYVGFIRKNNFLEKFQPTHKVFKKKTKIFIKEKNIFKFKKKFLYFASKIEAKETYGDYIKYEKNKWIKKSDTKSIDHIEKNFSKILKLFINTRYLWGGKSSDGIDCSALIQIFFYYNNEFFHRDTKDQIKSLKKIKKTTGYDKKKLIFWKGHVAYCLNKKNLIHAYGPKKKVLIMNINKTIQEIKNKSNLKVVGIRKINVD